MEEEKNRNHDDSRRLPVTPRDLLAIAFRRRRLIVLSFLGTFLGAILAILIIPSKYRTVLDILVQHQRIDPAVSADPHAVGSFSQDSVTDEEMNSEAQMFQSYDLLEQVVAASGLHLVSHPWSALIPHWATEDVRVAKAVKKLAKDLDVQVLAKSNVIEVSYSNSDPQMAARVLNNLAKSYLQKHLKVRRPPGAFDFFENRTEQYRTRLASAEERLAKFDRETGAVAAQIDMTSGVQKINDLEVNLVQAQAASAQTAARIRALEAQLASTPPRLTTTIRTSDNTQLLANLKSSLAALEIKRTELLTRYSPAYPLVLDVETQIAQTRDAIAAAEKAPVREDSTDRNPTYQLLADDLARAKADLPSFQAQAAATDHAIRDYRNRVIFLDQKGFQQQDLLRTVKAEEDNYLLYLGKREQERISSALDDKRIVNVVVQAAPVVPQLPEYSPVLVGLLGLLLAILVSIGSAFAAEYFDSSFRTPDEVEDFLSVPVLASIPRNGH